MKATVTTTSQTVTGNEILGTKDKTNYYLIIETTIGKRIIQIGETTKKAIDDLSNKNENNK